MHCDCCDRLLNDHEATRKSKSTGEYLNMCNKCLSTVDIDYESRHDLDPNGAQDDDYPVIDDQLFSEYEDD